MKAPIIVASECDAAHFPQNSLSGFQHCLDQNIDGIEFDVHLTKDAAIAVQHDYFLNKNITRTADGEHLARTGPALCDLTLDEIQTFDIGRYRPGSFEAKSYPSYTPIDGEQIPTLDQFLSLYAAHSNSPSLWIELKTSPFQREISSDPEKLLDAVLESVGKFSLESRCILLAFEWDLLVVAKKICPEIETDFLTINPEFIRSTLKRQPNTDPFELYGEFTPTRFNGDYSEAIQAAGGDWWGPYLADIDQAQIRQAQEKGLAVNIWGVESTEAGLDTALGLNAEALTLSDPCMLQEKLNIAG